MSRGDVIAYQACADDIHEHQVLREILFTQIHPDSVHYPCLAWVGKFSTENLGTKQKRKRKRQAQSVEPLPTLDNVSLGELWGKYLQKGRPKRPITTKLDTPQTNASTQPDSAGLGVSHKFDSSWLNRSRDPRPNRQMDPAAQAFLQEVHHPATTSDENIRQAMRKRAKDTHDEKASLA